MARYINADLLLQRLTGVNSTVEQGIKYYNSVYNLVIEQPTADVEEVRHGYWIDLNITEWQCSECNYRVERWNNTPYCPECGAHMDGGNAE